MTSENMDRRKKYTRMVLKESIIQLLKRKQLSQITVKEICELADINRSTFYVHFTDHFDLLEQIEDELIEDMDMYLGSYNVAKEEEALKMTERLIEYFASKAEICRILLHVNNHSSFEQKVRKVAHKYIMNHRMEIGQLEGDLSTYVSSFIISGSIEVMKVWLDRDMDKTPKEIAEIIILIINRGLDT